MAVSSMVRINRQYIWQLGIDLEPTWNRFGIDLIFVQLNGIRPTTTLPFSESKVFGLDNDCCIMGRSRFVIFHVIVAQFPNSFFVRAFNSWLLIHCLT